MEATFRLRRSHRNQALGFLPLFLGWGGLAAYAISTDPTIPHPLVAGLLAAGIPFFMAGMSALLLAAYKREQLEVRDDRVCWRGVVRSKELRFMDMTRARWSGSGRAVALRTGSARLSIDLTNYEDEDQGRIIDALRSFLPPEIQEGWNLFAYREESRRARMARAKPGPDEVLITRNRWNRFLVPTVVAASLAGLLGWWVSENVRLLAMPLFPLVAWGLLRFSTPTEGMISKKLSASVNPDMSRFLWFLLAWGLLGIGGLVLHEVFYPGMEQLDPALIVGLVAWLGVLLFEASRFERRHTLREGEAADLAAKGRGESTENPWPVE